MAYVDCPFGNLRGNALFAADLRFQEKDWLTGRGFFVRQNPNCHRCPLVNFGCSNDLFVNELYS